MSTPSALGKNPAQTRNVSRLNQKLDRKLTAYMAAAGAAGVSMLALAQPAEAKVVYTNANLNIGNVAIDLNNDGINDFRFFLERYSTNPRLSFLYVTAPAGNGWFGKSQAQPMFFGVPIGPGGNFLGGADIMATIGSTGSGGLWANKTNRYMGLKFMINGSHHFGWARLTVVHGTATITGYAYETIPNKPIIAGKTSGFAVSNARAADQVLAPFHQRASLGVLALGTNGLNIWRREEDAHVVAS